MWQISMNSTSPDGGRAAGLRVSAAPALEKEPITQHAGVRSIGGRTGARNEEG